MKKPLLNRGFFMDYSVTHKVFHWSVENFVVYRTLLKLHLRGENACVSGINICLRQVAIDS